MFKFLVTCFQNSVLVNCQITLTQLLTKSDRFLRSFIHQRELVESDDSVSFRSSQFTALMTELTSLATIQQAVNYKCRMLKVSRGATLYFTLSRITFISESIIDLVKTHALYAPLQAPTKE